jgi:hypothetical protein
MAWFKAQMDLARKFFLRKLRSSNWGNGVQTVATPDGVITAAPHYMAPGSGSV